MCKHNKYLFSFCLLFCWILISTTINAQNTERILNYHSDIDVEVSGRVVVTETIRINVTGQSISRGIVRTLPIYRKNTDGNKKRIDINIVSVKRDGIQEDYSTTKENSDFAVYIGNANRHLLPAVYEYTIQYESYGHVGFFNNYDEIYWNVTGNDWAFPIDSASATVHVPNGAKVINNGCYTGLKGSKSANCSYTIENDRIVNFTCTTHLAKGEGFTIATSFTPQIIKRPSPPSIFEVFVKYNYYLVMLSSSFVLLVCFILFIVIKYGTRNNRKLIVPSFNPPEGHSPASIRYLSKKKVDTKTLVASILSMAVKNVITIRKDKQGYIILKKEKSDNLSKEECRAYNLLFESGENEIQLYKNSSSGFWIKVKTLFKSIVESIYNIKEYFPSKTKYYFSVFLFSSILLGVWLAGAFNLNITDTEGIYTICITTSLTVLAIWWLFLLRKSCLFFLFLLIMGIPLIFVQYKFITSADTFFGYTFGFVYGLIFLNIIFRFVFTIKSEKGSTFIADLKGFKMYLKTAEEDRLNYLTPPDNTPEQFEKMLPYAVALDLEVKWAKKFTVILKENNYQPEWYAGNSITSYTHFTKTLSTSLTSTITKTSKQSEISYSSSASSSRSDRSSDSDKWDSGSDRWDSGSSGSGSSGGGGGGGGGRGW